MGGAGGKLMLQSRAAAPFAVPSACPLCLLRAHLAALEQRGTPRARPRHWAPRHRLGCSSEPPPESPIPPPLTSKELRRLKLEAATAPARAVRAGMEARLEDSEQARHAARRDEDVMMDVLQGREAELQVYVDQILGQVTAKAGADVTVCHGGCNRM